MNTLGRGRILTSNRTIETDDCIWGPVIIGHTKVLTSKVDGYNKSHVQKIDECYKVNSCTKKRVNFQVLKSQVFMEDNIYIYIFNIHAVSQMLSKFFFDIVDSDNQLFIQKRFVVN